MALDASNTGVLTDLSQDLPLGASRHYYNGNDNDSATAKEIVVTPGACRKLILTHLTLSTLTAQGISVLNGTTNILVGPFQLEAAGAGYNKDYKYGLSLSTNTPMYVISDDDALFHIYIEYINAPA